MKVNQNLLTDFQDELKRDFCTGNHFNEKHPVYISEFTPVLTGMTDSFELFVNTYTCGKICGIEFSTRIVFSYSMFESGSSRDFVKLIILNDLLLQSVRYLKMFNDEDIIRRNNERHPTKSLLQKWLNNW